MSPIAGRSLCDGYRIHDIENTIAPLTSKISTVACDANLFSCLLKNEKCMQKSATYFVKDNGTTVVLAADTVREHRLANVWPP